MESSVVLSLQGWVNSTLGEEISSRSVLNYSSFFSILCICDTSSVQLSELTGKLSNDLV